jgi:hypothetical protein
MKKKPFKGKLTLNKDTLARLESPDLKELQGGNATGYFCQPTHFCSYFYCTLTTPATCPTIGPRCPI